MQVNNSQELTCLRFESCFEPRRQVEERLRNQKHTICPTYVGLFENVGYIPNEIAIENRDND